MLRHISKPPVNPDEQMMGVCQSCKTAVETTRGKAFTGRGPWPEGWCVECPGCHAIIYLGLKPKVEEMQ